MTLAADSANAEQIRYWNETAAPKWIGCQRLLDAQLRSLGALTMDRAAVAAGERVIDVGCGWTGLGAFWHEGEVTGVDIVNRPGYEGERRSFVRADARALPFEDGSFDIAYSNSLLEHVAPADRGRVAREIRRVADRYFVQTPHRWFPIEPHVLIPLFQFLPLGLRRRLWRFGVSRGPFEDIRLLGARELRELFPDAVIVRERFGPLTKSLIALGPRERVRN
jgi:SAM-dependent methyltransferase